jgi:hypothetical protein
MQSLMTLKPVSVVLWILVLAAIVIWFPRPGPFIAVLVARIAWEVFLVRD